VSSMKVGGGAASHTAVLYTIGRPHIRRFLIADQLDHRNKLILCTGVQNMPILEPLFV
jgi:hypothetical protein